MVIYYFHFMKSSRKINKINKVDWGLYYMPATSHQING